MAVQSYGNVVNYINSKKLNHSQTLNWNAYFRYMIVIVLLHFTRRTELCHNVLITCALDDDR